MLRTGCICGDIRLIDGGGGHAGKLDFCFLSSFLETLHCHLVLRQVNALVVFKLLNHPVHDALVEVVAAQVVVASRCQHFQNAVANIQNRYVEGTAAKVIYHNLLLGFLINPVSQCCCGWLVDDTQDFKTCNLAGVLGCLTLCIGEVCWNGDDSLRDRRTDISLCVCLELLQNHSGNFLRRIFLILDVNTVIAAHVTLNRADGTLCIGYRLTLCNLTDHALTSFGECNNGRGGSCTLCVCDDVWFAALHDSDTAVCGT